MLEKVLPVTFEFVRERDCVRKGQVVMECLGAIGRGCICSRYSSPESSSSSEAGNEELFNLNVQFTNNDYVPFPFRGRALDVDCAARPLMPPLENNQTPLATAQRGILWRLTECNGAREYQSSLPLPSITPATTLKDVFNETRLMEILPLIHWLREISADVAYEGPRPRACFIFDDPNLHWPSYGFVDFRKVARQAAKENYHVSFATIPLDGWFTHPSAANVFRSNRSFLSMAVHGNDHTKRELARRYTEVERVALLRQSIHRIEQIERKAGFSVCRVMVPPHGACSEEMLALLPALGFEAACLSHGSLRAHNRNKAWTRTLGYSPSELVQGCSVLPRWGLSGKVKNTILLAAYLKQPIILRGHHQDLREGVKLLDQLAGFINGLGPVRWANLTEVSRSNYEWRMDGSICRLKPLGHRIDFQVPKGANGFVIDAQNGDASHLWQVSGLAAKEMIVPAGQEIWVPDWLTAPLSLSVAVPAWELPSGKGVRRPPLAAFVRRLLTEARDRLAVSY